MSKHTPGPWKLVGDETPWTLGDAQTAVEEGEPFGHTEILFSLNNTEGEPIAHLVWEPLASPQRCKELRANANLIAAAPELLDAALDAMATLCRLRERGTIGDSPTIRVLGRAIAIARNDELALKAIAKAEGRDHA